MQWTGIGNDVHLVEPVGTGVFYKYLRLYICNSKYTPWTKCFVALCMFIKVHRTNGFEIFSNPISVFFNILFSVQPPLCTYKRFFNTEKNPIYFDYMYIRINPKSFHARYSYLTQNVKLFVWYLVKRLQGFQPRYSGRKLLFIAIRRSAN